MSAPVPIGNISGPSPYDLAVAHGFEGTEEDWLASLHVGLQDVDALLDQRVGTVRHVGPDEPDPVADGWVIGQLWLRTS